MKTLLVIIVIVILYFSTAAAGELFRHYDRHYNIVGYSVIDDGKETRYDKNFNKIGTITTKGIHYNNIHERVETINSKGVIYDKNYNRIGTIINGTKYDNKGNVTGYIRHRKSN